MGHQNRQQKFSFEKINSRHRYAYGGILRKLKLGRGQRPLSTKDPLHLVFKAHRSVLRENTFRGYRSFPILNRTIKKYAAKFYVKIEQVGIEADHIHLLVRCSQRSQYHAFFRVCAGQIAQVFQKDGLLKVTDTPTKKQKLWKFRPFTRVVKSARGFFTAKNYVRLNEKEGSGQIPYRKLRLKGLSTSDWKILWS
jgi:putative transposase